jgi:hypothetical protein
MASDDEDETMRRSHVRRTPIGVPVVEGPRRATNRSMPAMSDLEMPDRRSRRHITTTDEIEVIRDGACELDARLAALESGRTRRPGTDEDSQDQPPSDALDRRIDARADVRIRRKLRLPKWLTGGAFALATGAGGASIKSGQDGAARDARTQIKIEVLEKQVERLEALEDARRAAMWPFGPRRIDQPDQPAPPATKGPSQ